jgi:hypothetical protein
MTADLEALVVAAYYFASLLPVPRRGRPPAARKLIYLAIVNAVPAWTRTRNWTTALLAFKIHFGERLPE